MIDSVARFKTVDGCEYRIQGCYDLGDLTNPNGRHSAGGQIPASPIGWSIDTVWVVQAHIVSAWWED